MLDKHSERKSTAGGESATFWLSVPHFTLYGTEGADMSQSKTVPGLSPSPELPSSLVLWVSFLASTCPAHRSMLGPVGGVTGPCRATASMQHPLHSIWGSM